MNIKTKNIEKVGRKLASQTADETRALARTAAKKTAKQASRTAKAVKVLGKGAALLAAAKVKQAIASRRKKTVLQRVGSAAKTAGKVALAVGAAAVTHAAVQEVAARRRDRAEARPIRPIPPGKRSGSGGSAA